MRNSLVLDRQRHLKWRGLDSVEQILMVMCGIALGGFTTTVFFDVVTRSLGHPWLWIQEVTTTFFVYGIFIGTAVATRRNDHLYLSAVGEAMTGRSRLAVETFTRLVVLGVGLCMVYYGYLNFLEGFGAFRMPSMTPLASLYAPIPVCGALVALFTVEQLVNGWRHGFAEPVRPAGIAGAMAEPVPEPLAVDGLNPTTNTVGERPVEERAGAVI